ncbi:NAD(P)H-quinone oxidoreductase [Roseixanthobacter pseudopolyaromaticivorans]|uniref:NAD(P)H-quinone oxidoreductase n=1 Tax=Xanthobacteraceae TaxID=335928 RepID=UPI003726B9ED
MTQSSSLPATMIAINITTPGGPEVLVPGKRPVPVPGAREILVKVEAAGVNRPDVVQRRGLYPAPPGASDIPGLEIAGIVVALGAEVTRFKLGDAVCALVTGGGYAQYCLSHEATALPVPEGLSMVEAAAIPETFFTVWSNVFDRGGLKRGETLLVHGGTGGIGTTAIQLGKAFGATVITTAGSAEKCTACLKLGADLAIDYKTQDFVAEVKSATGGKGANVILDVVGGAYIQRNYEAAAVEGRIVQIAFQDGSKVNIDFMRLMLKRLTHTGSTLRARPVADKEAIANALTQHVIPLIAAGTVRPLIDCTFPLEKASEAHARMDTSAHIGKIMLTVA